MDTYNLGRENAGSQFNENLLGSRYSVTMRKIKPNK